MFAPKLVDCSQQSGSFLLLRPEVRPAVINTWTNLGLIVDANCTYHTMIVCGSFSGSAVLRSVVRYVRAGWDLGWSSPSWVREIGPMLAAVHSRVHLVSLSEEQFHVMYADYVGKVSLRKRSHSRIYLCSENNLYILLLLSCTKYMTKFILRLVSNVIKIDKVE